jgi:hypothetical protein
VRDCVLSGLAALFLVVVGYIFGYVDGSRDSERDRQG